MPSSIKTDAVVLKAINYRETSKIVTFYTRELGRIAGIVKGARRPKNKYGPALEPMSYVHLVLYTREGREIQTVAECDLVRVHRSIGEHLEKMGVGMAMIELVNIISHEQERNLPLFRLLVDSLAALNDATNGSETLFYFFELQIARTMGFEPAFEACRECGRSLSESGGSEVMVAFDLGRGSPLCGRCRGGGGQTFTLRAADLAFLRRLGRAGAAEATGIPFPAGSRERITGFFRAYLAHHVSGIRPLRSEKVFSRLLKFS